LVSENIIGPSPTDVLYFSSEPKCEGSALKEFAARFPDERESSGESNKSGAMNCGRVVA
jgi:hypothetical protein